ncbi:MAG: L-type lectin-domain containing protein, partial [Nonlabens sp.]|uniref:L-type lectin-domain containing protein n=1 Tax=Nonlabens sp. TaxID=1888209 RepID=UPI003EF5D8A1
MKTALFKFRISLLIVFLLTSLITTAQFNPTLLGNATAQNNDCYRITQNQTGQSGAIWAPDQIDMLNDFVVEFRIFLGNNDANGADGLTFVLKNRIDPVIGGLGGGMGYLTIPDSFAVEFDTWQNANIGDPTFDHIAMVSGGQNDHNTPQNLAGPVQASATSINVEDGNQHDVRIEWNSTTQTMSVYFDCSLRLTYTGDLINQVFAGRNLVYFGFTGSTGGAANRQRVCFDYISFTDLITTLDDTSICLGDTVTSLDASVNGATAYSWTPITGVSDPTIANPTFTPAVTTTYTVDITNNCGIVNQESVTITVGPAPTANPVADFNVCDDASNDGIITYDLSQLDATIIGAQDPTLYAVSYYSSQADADSRMNALPTNFMNTTICERIYARIESIASNSCYNTTDFEICVSVQPVANPVAEYRLCDDPSNNGSEVFDLASRNPEVLGSQTAANFTIEYFVSQSDADLGSIGGATPVAANYSSGGQTMYVRIENATSPDCYDTTTFDLVVD